MSGPSLFSKLWNSRSQLLLWLMLVLIVLSVATTFYKTMILRDFVLINDIEETLEEEE